MAELTQTQNLPAPFIEALGKTYGEDLTAAIGGLKGLDVSKIYGPQFVAEQGALAQPFEVPCMPNSSKTTVCNCFGEAMFISFPIISKQDFSKAAISLSRSLTSFVRTLASIAIPLDSIFAKLRAEGSSILR